MKKDTYSLHQFLKDLNRFIYPYRWRFWPAVVLRLSSDISKLYQVFAVGRIVYLLTQNPPGAQQQVLILLALWPIIMTYEAVTHGYSKYIGNFIAEKAGLDAFLATLRHIYSLDLDWQEKENSGNKLKRANRGRDGINGIIRSFFNVMIEASVNTVGIILIFLTLDLRVSLALIFYIVSFYIVATYLTIKASNQERIVNKIDEDLEGLSFESLNNIKTVKALSIDHKIDSSITRTSQKLIEAIKKRVFLHQSRNGFLVWYFHLFRAAVIGFIIYGIFNGQFEVSLLVLFVGYMNQVAESTWELAEITHILIISRVWVQRMMGILHTKPIIENPHQTQLSYPKDWKELKIKDLSFGYASGHALKSINLTIKRGEKVGIVGLSGAGKSTLFKLLMDLYEDYEGDISLDNVSLKDIERKKYIDHVSVVLQETELFNSSLKDNIEIASSHKEHKSLSDVLGSAHLNELVEKLPKGLDTVVGEKGVKLSGGERQRVGIARALYRNPDILLMDEATSHLDVHSEKKIQAALEEFFDQVTAVVIAHRLSTIKKMDRIIVLEEGMIKEEGTFESLVRSKNGIFSKMWSEQS